MTDNRLNGSAELAAQFERQRPYLRAVARRMLGVDADADDAIQEAWLRLSRTGGDGIEDIRAWLTTVTSRICLDMLRARGARHGLPIEIDLDELLRDDARSAAGHLPTPEEEALLAESVGLALSVVMERLTPAERVAFVLHDIFDLPFSQIAEILGRSANAVKMLASRARRRVRVVAPETDTAAAGNRAIVDAFFEAAASGDLEALLSLIAEDAEYRGTASAGVTVLHGATEMARQARIARAGGAGAVRRPIRIRGEAGVLLVRGGQPHAIFAFTIRDGLITQIRAMVDPPRLAQIVPSWAT
ncbi:MAG TPA: sigma-70 family RNA polymerase sigma factor [Solirubrobacteraceae bacterium]|nr:sigma-70 family RNA polymerase sigma factor [Solirubrobacteraceae bacterium]